MAPETIFEVAERFRDELGSREAVARRQMVRAWEPVRARIVAETGRLTAKIAAREAQGRPVPVSWLFERERLAEWERKVRSELAGWRRTAEPPAKALVHRGATIGPAHALAMIRARAIPFPEKAARRLVTFRPEQVETIAAHLQAESPLAELLVRANAGAAGRMRETLVRGVGLGRDPRKVAAELGENLEEGFRRGWLIARTEGQRAYRETTRQAYRRNDELLAGWRWHSSLDRRACAACWAMHGTLHPVDERLDGHPACRCVMVPELHPEFPQGPSMGTGAERFAELPPEIQRRILGPGRHALYRAGEIELSDVVDRPSNPRWGPMRRPATIARSRGNAAVRRSGGRTPGMPLGPTTLPPLPPPVPPPVTITPPPPLPPVVTIPPTPTPPLAAGGPPFHELHVPMGQGQVERLVDVHHAEASTAANRAASVAGVRRAVEALGRVLRLDPADARLAEAGVAVRAYVRIGKMDSGTMAYIQTPRKMATHPIVLTRAVKRRPALVANTFAHEFGHFIDWRLGSPRHPVTIDNAGMLSEQGAAALGAPGGSAMFAFTRLALGSPEVKAIVERASTGDKWSIYASTPREIWARAFSQWVALRSGDAELQAEQVTHHGLLNGQWTRENFAPLAEAIDRVMREAGWAP